MNILSYVLKDSEKVSSVTNYLSKNSYIPKKKKVKLSKLVDLSVIEKEILFTLKSISDLTKFKILLLLQRQKLVSVKDIADILKLSPSAISHALSDLKMLNLVNFTRCGKQRCYYLSKNKKGKEIIKFLNKIL